MDIGNMMSKVDRNTITFDQVNNGYVLRKKSIIETNTFYVDHPVRVYGKFAIYTNGEVEADKSYFWDGASGVAVDTYSVLIPSLVHDILYEWIRTIKDKKYKKEMRKLADKTYYNLCITHKVNKWRAKAHYVGLRLIGWRYV